MTELEKRIGLVKNASQDLANILEVPNLELVVANDIDRNGKVFFSGTSQSLEKDRTFGRHIAIDGEHFIAYRKDAPDWVIFHEVGHAYHIEYNKSVMQKDLRYQVLSSYLNSLGYESGAGILGWYLEARYSQETVYSYEDNEFNINPERFFGYYDHYHALPDTKKIKEIMRMSADGNHKPWYNFYEDLDRIKEFEHEIANTAARMIISANQNVVVNNPILDTNKLYFEVGFGENLIDPSQLKQYLQMDVFDLGLLAAKESSKFSKVAKEQFKDLIK